MVIIDQYATLIDHSRRIDQSCSATTLVVRYHRAMARDAPQKRGSAAVVPPASPGDAGAPARPDPPPPAPYVVTIHALAEPNRIELRSEGGDEAALPFTAGSTEERAAFQQVTGLLPTSYPGQRYALRLLVYAAAVQRTQRTSFSIIELAGLPDWFGKTVHRCGDIFTTLYADITMLRWEPGTTRVKNRDGRTQGKPGVVHIPDYVTISVHPPFGDKGNALDMALGWLQEYSPYAADRNKGAVVTTRGGPETGQAEDRTAAAMARSTHAAVLVPQGVARRVMSVLPALPPHLIRRENDLAALASALAQHPGVTLCGLGGAGKSCLALQHAHDAATEYPGGVWWTQAAGRQPTNVLADLGEVLAAVGPDGVRTVLDRLRPESPLETRADVVLSALQKLDGPMLLVLDDVDGQGWNGALRAPHLKVIATTRDRTLALSDAVVKLGPFAESEALALSDAYLVPTSVDDAAARSRVLEMVGWLPLAVAVTAAAVSRFEMSWRDYEHDMSSLDAGAWEDDTLLPHYPRSLSTAIELSVSRCDDDALSLLLTCTAFAPEPVPREWVDDAWRGEERSEMALGRARSQLDALGLLQKPSEGLYLIHPLIHAHVRRGTRQRSEREWVAVCGRCLSAVHRTRNTVKDRSERYERIPHLLAILADTKDADRAAEWLAVADEVAGSYGTIVTGEVREELRKQAALIANRTWDRSDVRVAYHRARLAATWPSVRHDEAVAVIKQAIVAWRRERNEAEELAALYSDLCAVYDAANCRGTLDARRARGALEAFIEWAYLLSELRGPYSRDAKSARLWAAGYAGALGQRDIQRELLRATLADEPRDHGRAMRSSPALAELLLRANFADEPPAHGLVMPSGPAELADLLWDNGEQDAARQIYERYWILEASGVSVHVHCFQGLQGRRRGGVVCTTLMGLANVFDRIGRTSDAAKARKLAPLRAADPDEDEHVRACEWSDIGDYHVEREEWRRAVRAFEASLLLLDEDEDSETLVEVSRRLASARRILGRRRRAGARVTRPASRSKAKRGPT